LYKGKFSNVPEVKQIRDKNMQEYQMFADEFDGSSNNQLDEADRYRPREFTQKNNNKNPFKTTFITIVDEKIPPNHFLLTTKDERASYIIPKYKRKTKVGAFYLTVNLKGNDVDTILFQTEKKEDIALACKKDDLEKTIVPVEKGTAEKYVIKDDTKNIISPMLKSLALPRLSPIEIQDKDIIADGLDVRASGKVKSTLSFLENVDISFSYNNRDFNVKAEIPLDQIG
jgi:hypothetical protein